MGNWTQSNTNTTDNYAETFRYDANGNILQLNRNGNSQHPGGLAMDRLNYTYRDGTNQLWSVQDGIASGAYAGDIDNQGGSNYSFDRIGNLIGDVSENISQVNWTVYGKIGNIQKKQAFLGYVYNAGGERVVKQYLPYATNQCLGCDENTGMVDLEVYERNSNTPSVYKASKTITFLSEYTDVRYRDYSAIIDAGLAQCTPQCAARPPLNTSDADIYIRDATGNVLAVYHYDRKTAQLRWSEQHLYGSARLGMYQPEKVVTSVSTDSKQREVGYLGKQIFELSNHLGNALATISDKKLQVSTNTTSTDYFKADVQSVKDYYAFGMQMPGRKLSGGYRYGFNGKENDNEVKGEGNQQDYGLRIYDPRLGKFLSVDPIAKEYPWYTPYQFAGNTPIQAIDLDGGEPKVAGKNEAESGKDFVIAGTGPGGYGEIQRNWKWHSGGLTTSSGKKTQANWYSPDDYLTLLSKTNAAATTADKLNLFSSAAKGWQKSSADAGQRELENFVGDGSNDNAASSILMAAQIRANNANTSVSGRADLSSVNVEDFIGVGLLLKQLVKQGIKIGVGEAAKTRTTIKYLGRMEDLKGIPRSQTILDDLPNLGSPKANYYQNMSIIRRNLREGVTFKDASWFRPNSELAPTLSWPTRTVGQTFYGAERNLMQSRGLWPK